MTTVPEIRITVFGKTDVGLVREHNEDCFLIADVANEAKTGDPKEPLQIPLGGKGALFLVCDGMGGAAAGEVASQMAVESISSALAAADPLPREGFARRLRRAIEDANDRIYAQSRDNQSERGMGTTCTAVALVDGTLLVGQIGDSRCYVLRSGRLAQVTKDQSLAWQLIEAGAMTVEEAKAFEHANIILQALGVQERVDVALSQVPLRRGDVVLISSDGLHGPVSDEEMMQILQDEPDVKKACERLVSRALEREGPDNISVVVAHFDGPGLPDPQPHDVVQFVAYDPGPDPNDPPRSPRPDANEKVTVEVTIPKEVIGLTSQERAKGIMKLPAAVAAGSPRPFLTFMVLTLVAAVAGALFLIYELNRSIAPHTGSVRSPSSAALPGWPGRAGAADRAATTEGANLDR